MSGVASCPTCGHAQGEHDNEDITDPQGCFIGWSGPPWHDVRGCPCTRIFPGVRTVPAASPVTAGFEVSLDSEPRNPRQASLGAEANNTEETK